MKVTGEFSVSQMQVERKFSIWNFLGFSPPPYRFLCASFSYIAAINSTLQHIDTLSVRLTSMLSLDKACSHQTPSIPCSSQSRLRSSQVLTHTISSSYGLGDFIQLPPTPRLEQNALNKIVFDPHRDRLINQVGDDHPNGSTSPGRVPFELSCHHE